MIIGIHPDDVEGDSYSEKWASCLSRRGVDVRWLNLLDQNSWRQVNECDGVMWRFVHNHHEKQSASKILYSIENILNKPVFPDTKMIWHYDEKVAQYYLLNSIDAPMPNTYIFWDKEEAYKWIRTANFPLVFKLSSGAGSSNVIKLDSVAQAEYYIYTMFERGVFPYTFHEENQQSLDRSMFRRTKDAGKYLLKGIYPPLPNSWWWKPEKGHVYFQEYLPDNNFDTRVIIIGKKAYTYRRFNRPNDFRASGSGIIDYDAKNIDPECLRMAFDVSKRCGFMCMAYDFLYKNGTPVITEISYTFILRLKVHCHGYWDDNLSYCEPLIPVDEAQVEAFLSTISVKGYDQT